jgi:two-component system NtrC family response regulator
MLGPRNCTVLICGESGTGKELVARHIHAASGRSRGPFVTVDCTTLHDTLFDSQLFGHVRGAFTGAEESTIGLIRAAHGGTLLLDEVGELGPHLQAKLLRCIQDRAVVPVGGVKTVRVDVRLLAATHRDLRQLVREGRFREDLYFRIDVVRLDLPPLRARPGDILPLAEHFLAEQARMYAEPPRRLTPDARRAFRAHGWPGNVRELRNATERVFALAASHCIEVADLPEALRAAAEVESQADGAIQEIVPLVVAERRLVVRALEVTHGNQLRAARLLGVERHRLTRMIRRHGLQDLVRGARG